ncbi:MAG: hypothetical protein ACYCUV_00710 [Phycisphaerae bacterium]
MSELVITLMVVCASAAGIAGYFWHQNSRRLTWIQVNGMIQNNFPQVPQLSVPGLNTCRTDSHQ